MSVKCPELQEKALRHILACDDCKKAATDLDSGFAHSLCDKWQNERKAHEVGCAFCQEEHLLKLDDDTPVNQ